MFVHNAISDDSGINLGLPELWRGLLLDSPPIPNIKMSYITQNPVNGAILKSYPTWDRAKLISVLDRVGRAQKTWAVTSFEERAEILTRVANTFTP